MTTQQAFDLEKLTGESLNYKNEKKKEADVMRQKSSADVGSKE